MTHKVRYAWATSNDARSATVTQDTYQIHMTTFKAEPCEWGAWNQYLIFALEREGDGFDLIKVVGPHETIVRFLKSEGMHYLINDIELVA